MSRFFMHCLGAALFLAAAVAGAQVGAPKAPVVVELFTSEGCSSCPPADALLQKLEQAQPVRGAEIIALGEHVDYWDELGWRDRFSSHALTQRQNAYGERFRLESVYTPQMVVDGAEQFVGNDAGKARTAIEHAQQAPKVGLQLSGLAIEQRRVSGAISVTSGSAGLPRGDLYAALVEPTAVTNVKKGENSGRQLHHVSVVRSLQRIGSLQDLEGGTVKFSLVAPEDTDAAKARVVVFAQRSGQGSIVGAVVGNAAGTGDPFRNMATR